MLKFIAFSFLVHGWVLASQVVMPSSPSDSIEARKLSVEAARSQLWKAVFTNRAPRVAELLASFPDLVNASLTHHGMSALEVAVGNRVSRTQIVKLLLRAGATPDGRQGTALIWAATYGHTKAVQLLLRAGASVDQPRSFNGLTALMEASLRGHVEIVQLLLRAGARPDAKDKEGRTALMLATTSWDMYYGNLSDHIEIMRMLIKAGASLSVKNKAGHDVIEATRQFVNTLHPRHRRTDQAIEILEQAKKQSEQAGPSCQNLLAT